MKSKFYSDLQKEFSDFNFPTDKDTDLTELIKDKKVPQADTLALFSCRSTANKGRKRFKRTGQTASIYRSESLGGDQVGTLVNVLGVKQGPVFYESIPNQKAETVNPIIRSLIPHRTPIFTDMGYSSLGPNHRRVNHSLKSPDKRYKFNRQRWSKNGIHCQVPESQNNILKKAFRSYVYIKPKYSTLYLNEFSFFGNLRYFSLDDLTEEQGRVRVNTAADRMRGKVKKIITADKKDNNNRISNSFLNYQYHAKTLIEIANVERKHVETKVSQLLDSIDDITISKKLKKAHYEYLKWIKSNRTKDQTRQQRHFENLANKLWDLIPVDGYISTDEISVEIKIKPRNLHRIIGFWYKLGLLEVINLNDQRQRQEGQSYDLRRKTSVLLPVRYTIPIRNSKKFNKWKQEVSHV